MTSVKRPGHLISTLVALVISTAPLSVLAQSGGYYFEIAAGSTESRVEALPPLTSRSETTESTIRSDSYSLTGGWRFNDTFALEVSYTDHGKFSDQAILTDSLTVVERDPATNQEIINRVDAHWDADVDYELVSYGVSVLVTWPVSRRLNVYGRLGISSWEADSRIKGRLTYRGDLDRDWNVGGDLSDSGTSFFYGLGVFYRFTRNYAAKVEYQQTSMDSGLFTSDAELNALSLGIRYYF